MKDSLCEECFKKQRRIDKLTEELEAVKAKLRYQKRREKEGFFGSSTPSSKTPLKANSLEENQKKRGGAKPGHEGHGRKSVEPDQADKVYTIEAPVEDECPRCRGKNLIDVETARSVIDSVPLRAERIRYRLKGKLCRDCRVVFRAKAPSVMPKALYGNQLLTNVAVMHYGQGVPLGRLEEILDVPYSAMIQMLHRLARMFSGIPPKLIEQYRQSPVMHADETSWRTDGGNGYAWLFATNRLSIFEFRNTRSRSVPAAILGTKRLPGTLVTDRYAGYNIAPCPQQYCYAHLHRTLIDIGREFPDNAEVRAFVDAAAPLLAAAMGLRSQPISDEEYYRQAAVIARQIKNIMAADAQHLAIRKFQSIFRENKKKLYRWAKDRRIPADNNLAERDLRPTVIARKVSFGSQSEEGAKTRGILMTVLHTLKKQFPADYQKRLKDALDCLAQNPKADPYYFLFPP